MRDELRKDSSKRDGGILGAVRLGYGRCRGCGKHRVIFEALLVPGAPRGCRRCVALAVHVSRTLTEYRRLARACQSADRARAAARAARVAS